MWKQRYFKEQTIRRIWNKQVLSTCDYLMQTPHVNHRQLFLYIVWILSKICNQFQLEPTVKQVSLITSWFQLLVKVMFSTARVHMHIYQTCEPDCLLFWYFLMLFSGIQQSKKLFLWLSPEFTTMFSSLHVWDMTMCIWPHCNINTSSSI